MKDRRFFLFILLIVLLSIAMICILLKNDVVSESVYDNTLLSGDISSNVNNYYDVYIEDDMITFYDLEGNSIMYVFENDRLVNVFNLYNADNEIEAQKIASYFMSQVGNGEILDVNYLDTTVSVQMDMKFFSDYKDYSKKQIEELLIKNSNSLN